MQRLFSVSKVGLFLDKYAPGVEKRKGEEVKVVTLTLRAAPIDAKLATAIDDGIGGDSNVRASLFKLGHPDVKPHIDRVQFSLGCPRQNLTVFATPDTTDARLMLGQVRIAGTYARTQKDRNGYDFIFRGSLGPVGRDELEFIHDWCRSQRFVSFDESEPLLDTEDDGDDEGTDADQKARQVVNGRVPAPMWDDEATEAPTPAAKAKQRKNVNRKLHSHAKGKKARR
jgi:hypothetical protein